jgi:hypothetical protein
VITRGDSLLCCSRSGFTVWTDRIAPHIYLTPEGETPAQPLLLTHKDDQTVASLDVLPLVPRDDRGFWDRWAPFSAHLEEEVLPAHTVVRASAIIAHSSVRRRGPCQPSSYCLIASPS